MLSTPRTVSQGDHVLARSGFQQVKPQVITPGEFVSTRRGRVAHEQLIGHPYGVTYVMDAPRSKKKRKRRNDNDNKQGIVPLRPTPELWTSALRCRTQIIYGLDVSQVLQELQLFPGCVVYESGTGSGCLSSAIARTVAPSGRLHTFEFNEHRATEARTDFKNNGLDGVITVHHRDVCGLGFPALEGGVDAVFLDLPNPWVAVQSARNVLLPGGRIASFSPCIEQVQRTCAELDKLGFACIKTHEYLLRSFNVRSERSEVLDLEAPKTSAAAAAAAAAAPAVVEEDEDEDEEDDDSPSADKESNDDDDSSEPATKKQRADPAAAAASSSSSSSAPPRPPKTFTEEQYIVRADTKARGHTGYLTFAIAQ